MRELRLGESFADPEVAALYRHRPPYPTEVFAILERLLVEPRTILDAGAGTGALARELVRLAERVDALDPSEAMIAQGRRLPHGDDLRLRWILGRAEDGPVDPPYGLITCGASLHWMDQDVVLRRFNGMLAPGARVAITDTENVHASSAVREEVLAVIVRYSPLEHHVSTDEMIDGLVKRGAFVVEGREVAPRMPFEQSVDEYIGLINSTSTLNRAVLGSRSADFERDMRAIFARHGMDRVRYDIVGGVVWGRPAAK
jgi:SAM-dependent methyltransferase